MDAKEKLLNCIKLEIELMGEMADIGLTELANNRTPREMLGCSIEFLEGSRPALGDVCYFIEKVRFIFNNKIRESKKHTEITLRLIELVWKIEQNWKFIHNKMV